MEIKISILIPIGIHVSRLSSCLQSLSGLYLKTLSLNLLYIILTLFRVKVKTLKIINIVTFTSFE